MLRLLIVAAFVAAPAPPASGAATTGQLAQIDNARVSRVSAHGALAATIERTIRAADEPIWIGYEVPAHADAGSLCCFVDVEDDRECCGACSLEQHGGGLFRGQSPGSPGTVELEASTRHRVLLRAARGRLGKIRVFSASCRLDVGGLPLVWIDDAGEDASVAFLADLVDGAADLLTADDPEDVRGEAVMAIGLHRSDAALAALERFARAGFPHDLRDKAIFWLGAGHHPGGITVLEELVARDPSPAIRERAVFGLHVSRAPDAVDTLIRVAHDDADAGVRKQAIFWLANAAGERAAAAIEHALVNDPDEDVKERAVFGLSQLPPDRGIPLLIRVARTNPSAKVRKRAIFWLGQSGDPRALDFIEELLRG